MTFSSYSNVYNFQRILLAARKEDSIPLFGWDPTEFRLIFTLDFFYQRQHHRLQPWNFPFLQPPCLQRYADEVAGKGTPSYNWFGFVDGTIFRICKPVLDEKVVYSRHTKVHGVKFQIVVFPNDLITRLEGQWEGRRHNCILCFMNRVY